MKTAVLSSLLLLSASAGLAECPEPPDHTDRLAALFNEAREVRTEMHARELSQRMWQLWADAPDEVAQAMLDRGMRKRSGYDFLGAISDFDALVEYCPDYAEGYNQRAFALYLSQNFEAALADLDLAIQRSPTHVAALSGRALTLMALGRMDEAREALAMAMALNPWIPERGLAAPGGPLEPKAKDI